MHPTTVRSGPSPPWPGQLKLVPESNSKLFETKTAMFEHNLLQPGNRSHIHGSRRTRFIFNAFANTLSHCLGARPNLLIYRQTINLSSWISGLIHLYISISILTNAWHKKYWGHHGRNWQRKQLWFCLLEPISSTKTGDNKINKKQRWTPEFLSLRPVLNDLNQTCQVPVAQLLRLSDSYHTTHERDPCTRRSQGPQAQIPHG